MPQALWLLHATPAAWSSAGSSIMGPRAPQGKSSFTPAEQLEEPLGALLHCLVAVIRDEAGQPEEELWAASPCFLTPQQPSRPCLISPQQHAWSADIFWHRARSHWEYPVFMHHTVLTASPEAEGDCRVWKRPLKQEQGEKADGQQGFCAGGKPPSVQPSEPNASLSI